MNVKDYLDTVYYIDGAAGEDADLWEGEVIKASSENTTLNGYYSRLKKLNDTIIPISEEVAGLQSELI
jgi:hypothetical protein